MKTLPLPLANHLDFEPSATLRINERVKELSAQGETVYHFGFGESRFPVHPLLQGALRENVVSYYPEGTIVVGGLSKHLSLGGWRLGKAILPASQPQLMQALIGIGSEIWSTASAPIQYAAITAYSGHPDIEVYIAECAHLHTIRTQHIWSWLSELGIRCPQPQGGFYMMPDFNRWREPLARRGVHTSAQLSEFLLEEYRLASLPGLVFGVPDEELVVRLSTSFVDLETDQQAEDMVATWRSKKDANIFIEAHHPTLAKGWQQFERLVVDLSE